MSTPALLTTVTVTVSGRIHDHLAATTLHPGILGALADADRHDYGPRNRSRRYTVRVSPIVGRVMADTLLDHVAAARAGELTMNDTGVHASMLTLAALRIHAALNGTGLD